MPSSPCTRLLWQLTHSQAPRTGPGGPPARGPPHTHRTGGLGSRRLRPTLSSPWMNTQAQRITETLRGLHHVMDGPHFPADGWQSRRLQTDPCGPNATAPTPQGHSSPTCLPCEIKYRDTSRRKTSGSSGRGIRTQMATCQGSEGGRSLGGALGQQPGGLLGTGPSNAQLGGGAPLGLSFLICARGRYCPPFQSVCAWPGPAAVLPSESHVLVPRKA